MKLSTLSEMNRREFMQKSAVGVSNASSLGKLASGAAAGALKAAPAAAAVAGDFDSVLGDIWELIHKDFFGSQHKLQLQHSPQEMSGVLKRIFAGETTDLHDLGNFIGVSNTTKSLDEYTNGAYTKELGEFIQKQGPVKVAKLVFDYGLGTGGGWTDMASVDETTYSTMIDLASKFPAMAKMFPASVFEKALETRDPRGPMELARRHKLMDDDVIDRRCAKHKDWKKRREEVGRNSTSIKPTSDDHIYGSSMHQPFESRLNRAFGCV